MGGGIDQALAKTIAEHLPSPVEAQVYRAEVVYAGSAGGEFFTPIARCDEDGTCESTHRENNTTHSSHSTHIAQDR